MDQTDITLEAVVRALTDVVAPALDEESALAREQLRLSIDHLRFIAMRLDLLHARAGFELRHHLRLAVAVREALGEEAQYPPALDDAVEAGAAVLAAPTSSADALRTASADVAAAISMIVRSPSGLPADTCHAVVGAVVAGSAERVAFERSWYAPLGIDPDRDELPPVEQLLDDLA